MATRLPAASQQAAADAVVDRLDAGAGAGLLRIYSGSQPADADDAASGTLLAELTFSDPAFGAANSSGVATASAITADSSANATGTAGWFRCVDSAANTVFDGAVSTSGAELNLDSTSITSGQTVSVTALTYTHPAST